MTATVSRLSPDSGATAAAETTSEAAARAELRRQIAVLEARGGRAAGRGAGPSLLSLGELEQVRDALIASSEPLSRHTRLDPPLDDGGRGGGDAQAWFEAMAADPRAHKWMRIRRADLGVPGCGEYRVVPRLGLIGMLAGWWHVTLSSGCP